MMSVKSGAFRFTRKGGGMIGLRALSAVADSAVSRPPPARDASSTAIAPCIEHLEQRLCLSATASTHHRHPLSVFENDVNVMPHGCVPPKGYAFGRDLAEGHQKDHGRGHHKGHHKDDDDET